MIKVYTLKRLRTATLTVTDGNVSIRLNFAPSYGTMRSSYGKVIISDPNVQKILEADQKYGIVYSCTDMFEDKKSKVVTNANGDIANVEQTSAKKAKSKKAIVFDEANEALEYLEKKGENVTPDNYDSLLEKYNITINE